MRVRVRRATVAFTAVAALFTPLAISAPSGAVPPPDGTILTLTWEAGHLFSLDPANASSTLIGTSSLLSSTGIEWDESTGTLFGVDYDNTPASLYKLDPASGAATVVGAMGINNPTAIASQPATGNLFIAYDNSDSGSTLATVDKTTAAVTDIGPIGESGSALRISGMAFRRVDGALYGFTYESALVRIDPSTGHATTVAAQSFHGFGVDFDCQDNLVAVSPESTAPQLVRVNTTNGATTAIGSPNLGGDFTENLTVVCNPAEPPPPPPTQILPTTTPTTHPAAQAIVVTPRFTG